jgi:hypothetical protein
MAIRRSFGAAGIALLLSLPVSAVSQDAPASAGPSSGQSSTASAPRADLSVWVGATLSDAHQLLGPPRSVRAVRGPEAWQDDVVFSYEGLELYVLKDRVWKVRSDSAFGFKLGADRDALVSLLGEPLHRLESDFIYQLPGRAWPIRLRVRFGEAGGATDIYVYRADY